MLDETDSVFDRNCIIFFCRVGLLTNLSVDFADEVAMNHDVYGVACKRKQTTRDSILVVPSPSYESINLEMFCVDEY